MQKIQKMLSIFLVLAIGLLLFANSAQALQFTEIKVNGVEYNSNYDVIHVDREDTVDIRVELFGDNGTEDRVRVKAWIGGYKYDNIEDTTNMFTVLGGTLYVKNLKLEMPEDMNSQDDYTLHIEAYDNAGYSEIDQESTLRVTPIEDVVKIQDVIINPGLSVEAGKPIYVTVRAKNFGENKQDDVRVKVSIPELGISTRTYINELCSLEEYCDGDNDEEDSASSGELMLKIPETVKEGTYELLVELEYDRFHKSTSETYLLNVESKSKTTTTSSTTDMDRIIAVDTATQEVSQGKGVIYRITLANLGDKTETYNIEVSGVETWGTSRVDPNYVVVEKDSTGEAFVYIAANENAVEGLHMFTAKIKANNEVVKEISLGADVNDNERLSLTQILWIVFGVLVLVVLILGIILLVRGSRDNSDSEEPINEGQTYY